MLGVYPKSLKDGVGFSVAKGSVFFISPEKIDFWNFWSKIVWVSKKAVFFFHHRKKKQTFQASEWVNLNFSRKKKQEKKHTIPEKKKSMYFFSKSLEMSFEEENVHIYSYI